MQLLAVVSNIIQVAGPLCKSSSFKLFVLLLKVSSFFLFPHIRCFCFLVEVARCKILEPCVREF